MLSQIKLQIAANEETLRTGFLIIGVVLLLGSGYVYLTPEERTVQVEPDPSPDPDPTPETESFEAFFLEVEPVDSAVVTQNSTAAERILSGPKDQVLKEGDVLTRAPVYDKDYLDEITFNITANTTAEANVALTTELYRQEQIVFSDWRIVDQRENILMYREDRLTEENAPQGMVTNRRAFDLSREQITGPAEVYDPNYESASLNTSLILDVTYNTTNQINGKSYRGLVRLESTVSESGSTFELGEWSINRPQSDEDAAWVTDDQQTVRIGKNQTRKLQTENETQSANTTQSATTPTTRTIQEDPDMQLVALLSILGVVSVATGGTIAAKAPQIDEEELQKQVTHSEYSEWISEGELVLDSGNEYVYVGSVEDLVNVAIDTDKRVIHDPDFSVYTVTDGKVIYYYTAEPSDLERWANI